jgi:glutaredoxin-related protein
MKILFYSDNCEFSNKIIQYIKKNNIDSLFKMINIHTNKIPQDIKIVPTIIDTDLNNIMEGKNAFEYLINIKYFNIPTNNIEYIYKIPENPKIIEDKLAIQNSVQNISLEITESTQVLKDASLLPQTKDVPIKITRKALYICRR